MNPVCAECRGACCESFVISLPAEPEVDVLRWLGYRGTIRNGALRLDVPCSFAAAGAEGPANVLLFVADDLGHEVKLASSLAVDDRGPVLAVDAASVPASAVRGAKVPLRVTARDLSGVAGVR